MPLPQRLHRLTPELQTCTGGRPEPRAIRAGGGEALLEKQELWVRGVVFGEPLVKVNTRTCLFDLTRPEKWVICWTEIPQGLVPVIFT